MFHGLASNLIRVEFGVAFFVVDDFSAIVLYQIDDTSWVRHCLLHYLSCGSLCNLLDDGRGGGVLQAIDGIPDTVLYAIALLEVVTVGDGSLGHYTTPSNLVLTALSLTFPASSISTVWPWHLATGMLMRL